MILETLDVKKNDIFIYSLNQFSLSGNFKLLNKDAAVKNPKSIHFNDVCRYISDGRPKNLVLYRLLTNIPNMDPNYIKYGLVLNVDGTKEVLYFDPIFALKELEEFSNTGNNPPLRFRIQQIGLISMMMSFRETQFHEVYCFDLEALEVKNQNDRVFAEIIFVFDEINFDRNDTEPQEIPGAAAPEKRLVTLTSEDLQSDALEDTEMTDAGAIRSLSASKENKPVHAENEDADVPIIPGHFDFVNLQPAVQQPGSSPLPPAFPAENLKPGEKRPIVNIPKQNLTFGDFLTKIKKNIEEEEGTPHEITPQVINLFKTSAHIQGFVSERTTKQVILKLKKR